MSAVLEPDGWRHRDDVHSFVAVCGRTALSSAACRGNRLLRGPPAERGPESSEVDAADLKIHNWLLSNYRIIRNGKSRQSRISWFWPDERVQTRRKRMLNINSLKGHPSWLTAQGMICIVRLQAPISQRRLIKKNEMLFMFSTREFDSAIGCRTSLVSLLRYGT